MTTGSYYKDDSTYPPGYVGGFVGTRASRWWDGPDSAPRVKTQRQWYHYEDVGYDRKGRAFVVKRKIPILPDDYKPSREHREEHPYSTTWYKETSVTTWIDPYNDGTWDYGPRGSTWFGVSQWSLGNVLTSESQYELIARLKRKLQGSEFNLGIFLGEGHQALTMVGNAAIRLAKYLHHMRRADFLGAHRALFENTSRAPIAKRDKAWGRRTAAQNHLEWTYGWFPLLSDMKAGAEFLARHLEVPLETTYRVNIKAGREATRDLASGTSFKGSCWAQEVQRRWLIARLKEQPGLIHQLGLSDPASIAWEVLPFSFVADWVIPIGDYLAARGFTAGLVGTFVTSDKSVWTCHYPQGSPMRIDQTSGPMRVNGQFVRSVSTSLDVPMPRVRSLGEAFSWRRALNAVALVTVATTLPKRQFDDGLLAVERGKVIPTGKDGRLDWRQIFPQGHEHL